MRKTLTWILAIVLAINGLAMLLVPQTWFALVPSVPPTGPFTSVVMSPRGGRVDRRQAWLPESCQFLC